MPKRSTSITAFALVSVFAAIAGVTGMTSAPLAHRGAFKLKGGGFSARTMAALNSLSSELTRRFTDRQNVTFGMARVIRENSRIHSGPISDIHRRGNYPLSEDKKSYVIDGKNVPLRDLKPMLHPENPTEQSAVDTFAQEKCEVAIYTVGNFAQDRGEAPKMPGDRSSSEFIYGGYGDIRAKGPAYIRQDTSKAPPSREVVVFARKAWATGQTDFDADGPDGWHYFAHRIAAPDESCMRCHATEVKKAGDPVGIFIIALRPKPTTGTK